MGGLEAIEEALGGLASKGCGWKERGARFGGTTYNDAHAHDVFLGEITPDIGIDVRLIAAVRLVGRMSVTCCTARIAVDMAFIGMMAVDAVAVITVTVDVVDIVVRTIEVPASVAVIDGARDGRMLEKR